MNRVRVTSVMTDTICGTACCDCNTETDDGPPDDGPPGSIKEDSSGACETIGLGAGVDDGKTGFRLA